MKSLCRLPEIVPRDPRFLREGTLGRIPGAGLDRSGIPASNQIPDLRSIQDVTIHTSHHTHAVIGSGANDPQSLTRKPARNARPQPHVHLRRRAAHRLLAPCPQLRAEVVRHPDVIALWQKIKTVEDPRGLVAITPRTRAKKLRGRVEMRFTDGAG